MTGSCPYCGGTDLAETNQGKGFCLDCEKTWTFGGSAERRGRRKPIDKPIDNVPIEDRFPHSLQIRGSYENLLWKQRDGTQIRVGDMTPLHAFHAWRMMIRGLKRYSFGLVLDMLASAAGPFGPSGDGACDAFDSAVAEFERLPLTHAEREDIVKALWLRSLDKWDGAAQQAARPEWGTGVPSRWEGVALWERYKSHAVCTETRWAACSAIGPNRWRSVCVGTLEAVWQFARDGANRSTHYKVVRLEYVDPTSGIYTEDKWERKERERLQRLADDPNLSYRLSRYHVRSPGEQAAWDAGRAERDRELAEELAEETAMADEDDAELAQEMAENEVLHDGYPSGDVEWHPEPGRI